jgi:hypothetical protein
MGARNNGEGTSEVRKNIVLLRIIHSISDRHPDKKRFRLFEIESQSHAGLALTGTQISRNAAFTQCSSLAYYSLYAVFPAMSQGLVKSGHLGSLK